MTSSNHDIASHLSKYDHFLSREDIMSPLKQANPTKIIYDTIPKILFNQFQALLEIFENGEELNIPSKATDEWDMVFKEEFLEKNLKVFSNKKNKNRGMVVIQFFDRNDKEIFAVKYFI